MTEETKEKQAEVDLSGIKHRIMVMSGKGGRENRPSP